jgi:hypothetical protein
MKTSTTKNLLNKVNLLHARRRIRRAVTKVPFYTFSIVSLGLVLILSFRGTSTNSVQAATTVPTDAVTIENIIETSQFNTPNDPTDDTIEYSLAGPGTDTFTYEICDATVPTPDCATATVTINPVPPAAVTDISLFSPLSVTAVDTIPTAGDDIATVADWVNIKVLVNDDFGLDGPGTGPIKIFPDCATCLEPTNGTARVNDGPRSPDPSGLAYISPSGTLLISDGEVNEVFPPNPAAYAGINLFFTTLSGSLVSTLTTYDPPAINVSDEPSGVAYNPANNHLFFTDDNGPRVLYELDPGPDDLFNTIGDTVNTFDFSFLPYIADPEGVTYDGSRGQGHVLVVDGANEKVYDIDLSSNGILDSSDPMTTFNVDFVSPFDPEGIEFNPDNGHLYILSSTAELIAETTIDGSLLRYLDISSLNPDKPAGLAYAPSSSNPSQYNLYIVDRQVDNLVDPNENDGKLYEVSFPLNAPPYVNAGADDTIVLPPGTYNLDGTVIDDGLPSGSVTTTWSQVSPIGLVIFNDPSAIDTVATFNTPAVYVLRLTANDGARTNYDEITITVNPVVNQAPLVDAGPNQAILLEDPVTLNAEVIDDGLPNPPASFTTQWTKVSGLGTVNFTDANAVDTTASFSMEGVYVLRLTADDAELTNSDLTTVTVTSGPNQPPLVDAGPPQTITLPENAFLDGTVTDDGLPSGTLTADWSVVSGPGIVNFADASAVDTTASFSTHGVYALLLTVSDGPLSSFNDVTITVNPPETQTLWLPIVVSNP